MTLINRLALWGLQWRKPWASVKKRTHTRLPMAPGKKVRCRVRENDVFLFNPCPALSDDVVFYIISYLAYFNHGTNLFINRAKGDVYHSFCFLTTVNDILVCPCPCSVKQCLDDSVLLGFSPGFFLLALPTSLCMCNIWLVIYVISDLWSHKKECNDILQNGFCFPLPGNGGIGSSNTFYYKGTKVVLMGLICLPYWVSFA